jgi:16S rRNA (uracil1498-N3)-methyltransferase
MNLPFFYKEIIEDTGQIVFDEETSRHIVQVLRMKQGDVLKVTDGKGRVVTAEIADDHKKKCLVKIRDSNHTLRPSRKISVAISLLKNASRFEWFLEKATEIGVQEIIPLLCDRTEKQHFRYDRMKNICISAMLQSQQVWLPDLSLPRPFGPLIDELQYEQKYIAHCMEKEKRNLSGLLRDDTGSRIILIGPEGDFTIGEIDIAIQHLYLPVSLGETRLRTETAGIVAAALLVNN